MKLTVLGSGTFLPHPERNSSGYLVELEHTSLLLDCGTGTTWAMARLGRDFRAIEHILLTHLHPDHTADLVPMLFARRYAPAGGGGRDLRVWGPEGVKRLFAGLGTAWGEWVEPVGLEVIEGDWFPVQMGDARVDGFPTRHTEGSRGYRIEQHGKVLVYTGDTDLCDDVIEAARGAGLLLIECSFPDERKASGHLTPSEVANVVQDASPARVVITHLYPELDAHHAAETISRATGVEVIAARDGLEIDL